MIIKNKEQFAEYQKVCDISVDILKKIKDSVKVGIKTKEIDEYADALCKENEVESSFRGARVGNAPKYEYASCISLNDTVVHGVPGEEKISEGDIVKVDFGIIKDGYYTDHCFTVGVEPISDKKRRFIIESRNALALGVEKAIDGKRIGDIGHAIESHIEKFGYSVVKNFVGHGIGKSLHEYPDVPAYGDPGTGDFLQKGLVLCIEAQIIDGEPDIYISDDNWTVKTRRGVDACMFEYIVMVDKNCPRILTDTLDWNLFVNNT
jgi:methionyl aminopeptidase